MSNYLNYWKLHESPFDSSHSQAFFFVGKRHSEALERMLYLIADGNLGIGLLTGEIGCGKSMVLNQLAAKLRGTECLTVMLENSFGDFDDLLREILAEMTRRPGARYASRRTLPAGESRYELIARFRKILDDRVMRSRRQLVLVLDEAQQLSEQTLIELKNLTNFALGGAGTMSLILAGQPELGERVQSLPQIDQRIGIRYHLLPMNCEEVGEYIRSRLIAAGHNGEDNIFSQEAVGLIAENTAGIPREINRICKLALDRAYSLEQETVGAEIVRCLVEDVIRQNAYAY